MKSYADLMYEEGYQEGLRQVREERRRESIKGMLAQLRAADMPEETILVMLAKGFRVAKKVIRGYMAESSVTVPSIERVKADLKSPSCAVPSSEKQ